MPVDRCRIEFVAHFKSPFTYQCSARQAVPFNGDRHKPAGGMNWAPFNDPVDRNVRDCALRVGSCDKER